MSFTPLFRRWGAGGVPFKKEMESQYHGVKKNNFKKNKGETGSRTGYIALL